MTVSPISLPDLSLLTFASDSTSQPDIDRLTVLPAPLFIEAHAYLSLRDLAKALPTCTVLKKAASRIFERKLSTLRVLHRKDIDIYCRFSERSLKTPQTQKALLARMPNVHSLMSTRQRDYALHHLNQILSSNPSTTLTTLELQDDDDQFRHLGRDDKGYDKCGFDYVDSTLLKQLAPKCANITTFSFTFCGSLSDEQLSYLVSFMRNVESVSLAFNDFLVLQKTVQTLAKSPSLKRLNLSSCLRIEPEDISHLLSRSSSLTDLDLSHNIVCLSADKDSLKGTYEAFEKMAHTIAQYGTELVVLRVRHSNCTSSGLINIVRGCTKLVHLDLRGSIQKSGLNGTKLAAYLRQLNPRLNPESKRS